MVTLFLLYLYSFSTPSWLFWNKFQTWYYFIYSILVFVPKRQEPFSFTYNHNAIIIVHPIEINNQNVYLTLTLFCINFLPDEILVFNDTNIVTQLLYFIYMIHITGLILPLTICLLKNSLKKFYTLFVLRNVLSDHCDL